MQLIEDDAEVNPSISPAQLNYIRSLTDSHKQYTRFFDALLVPRPSHAAFFRDLKGFRSLPTVIQAFTKCDPDDVSISKEQRKLNYRDVTNKFLGSHFAHPWCRKAMGGVGNSSAGGWWGAEWTATGRKMSKENREQEEKLHRLLIPLWVCFRSKMFPGAGVAEEWWDRRQAAPESPIIADSSNSSTDHLEVRPDDGIPRGCRLSSVAGSNYGSHEDSDADNETTTSQAGSAATGLLRLAAAGIIINSMPKMQKWKLKRELKNHSRSR